MKFGKFKNAKTLSLASLLSTQDMGLAAQVKQNEFLYISCLEDKFLGNESLIRCEIGSVSYVLALLCKYSLDFGKFDESVRGYFDELDEGFLSGECNVGEEEFEGLAEFVRGCENVVIDGSFLSHPDVKMIFELLNLLDKNVVLAGLNLSEFETSGNLTPLKELENFDGSVVFFADCFDEELVGSGAFAAVAKIKDGDLVEITANGVQARAKFRLEGSMKGTVALCGAKFEGYAFKLAKIARIEG